MTNFQVAESMSVSDAAKLDGGRQIFWMMANSIPWQRGESIVDWAFRAWSASLSKGEQFTIQDAQQAYRYARVSNPDVF